MLKSMGCARVAIKKNGTEGVKSPKCSLILEFNTDAKLSLLRIFLKTQTGTIIQRYLE